MSEHKPESSAKFRGAFVIILALAISTLFFALIWSFLKPLLLAAIFTAMVYPIYRRLLILFRRRETPASIATILIVILLILGPLSGFVGIVAKQAVEITQSIIPDQKEAAEGEDKPQEGQHGEETQEIGKAKSGDDEPTSDGEAANTILPWFKDKFGSDSYNQAKDWVLEKAPFMADFLPDRDQILNGVANLAQSAGQFLVNSAQKMTAGTASFFLSLFVMLYAMFFFLIDGRKILEKILYYIPLGPDEEELMLDRFLSITRATIKGTMLIGLIQGTLGGIGFAVAGIGGAAFWGTIMVILSIVPGIGTALVWIPAVIYLLATGDVVKGVILGTYMAAVVGTIDNVLRPILVGRDAEMPDLLILLGTLGGIFMFGVIGFIIGPVICGLFLMIWEIYGETFKAWLPPVKPLHRKKLKPDADSEVTRSEVPKIEEGESEPKKNEDAKS
ncbi:MAG: AI-2E family transporter [Verrucomicrobiae bacterium]|nr:AI-2E family transporter [Verrucomicrobiae bacterium]